MKTLQVEVTWDETFPVNWEFVGMVLLPDGRPPEFVLIDGVKYERRRSNE